MARFPTNLASAGGALPRLRASAFGWRCAPFLALQLVAAGIAPEQKQAAEYTLKAAVLCNLARFVEWPVRAAGLTNGPLVIGVLGVDPFGSALDEATKDQTVQGRKLAARRFGLADDPSACHLLFISRSEADRLPALLARLRGSGVLTVSEISRFAERGGMVNLVMKEDRVRFEISVVAAEREGVAISSKVLKYATIVAPEKEPPASVP